VHVITRTLLGWALAGVLVAAEQPDVKTIVQRSVAANERDFQAAPQFNYKQKEKVGNEIKSYQVTMIDGSPYQRLVAEGGTPFSKERAAEELKKEQQAITERKAQSPQQRRGRIADYEKDRKRDHEMMAQLSDAFDFTLAGKKKVRKFNVWVLKATPRAGYKPPNMEAQVLRGMEGEMWIDQKTYQWVKVTARVIRPVSIEGFLAQVEPGTRFELEKGPVAGGSWQPTHFSMQSHSKVLFLVNHASEEEDWFYDYEKSKQ
jgi:hypothetical protein